MDALILARIQFAFTIAFHFIFPSLTVGLSWYIVWFMTKYSKSGSKEDEYASRFWIKLFSITFAVGVATGITMALQFGTNWASYAKIVGEVIGAPLAAEVIMAFFMESTFLAILIFGWNIVSKRILWISSLLVAIGTTLSAFWIIVVNSWMQTPAGFNLVLDSEGKLLKVELVDFFAAVFNPSTIVRFLHTVTASLLVASFFVFGITSYYRLKKTNENLIKFSYKAAMILILVTSVGLLLIGHMQASVVAETQPEKFATYELVHITNTDQKFPMVAIIDPFTGDTIFRIDLPFFSLADYMLMGNKVFQGLDSFTQDELPPFVITVYSFHFMILLGLFFIVFGLIGIFLVYKNKIEEDRKYNNIFSMISIVSIPLPFIALQLGWMAAEVGRQPWIVYGILKTSESISVSVPEWQILFSLIMFVSIYFILFILWITLLIKTILTGPVQLKITEN
jgi:cytochrome d ubiquinol oxidase subunit I